jgi:uncharacterized protein (TIGR00730 family)
MNKICVYCGSSLGFNKSYANMAKKLGQYFVENNIELVYGGSNVGLMGILADTVLDGGGKVTGIIPRVLLHKVSHKKLTKMHIVESMHERKSLMFKLSDRFIALPGGFGTLEELTEMLTWSQIGINTKPCGILNVDNYYSSLLVFIENMVNEGFMKREHKDMLIVETNPQLLFSKFETYEAPKTEKWIRENKGEDQ